MVWCATIVASISAQTVTVEPPEVRRPDAANRLVAQFTFDEQDNPQEVPVYWFRGQDEPAINRKRPGFPNWNKAVLDLETQAQGGASVKLPVRGGSTSLILERGVIPVFDGADYQVTLQIRTQHLKTARAVVEARFLDASGKVIESSIIRSRPIITDGQWKEVSIDLLGGAHDVAFLQVEFLVLQADQLKTRDVVSPDLSGAAWFDEMKVVQLPRIELSSRQSGNVLVSPAKPTLEVSVRDLTGEQLDLQLEVFDARGERVFVERRAVPPGRSVTSFMPVLPGFGWFRSRATVQSAKESVGNADVDFVYLREAGAITGADHARFGLVTDDPHPVAMSAMTALASGLGVSQVTLPAWFPELEKANISRNIQKLVPVVESLSRRGFSVGLSLPRTPEELAQEAKIDADLVWPVFKLDPQVWQAYLDPFLDRFGQRVTFWRIGSIATPQQGTLSTLPARINVVHSSLSRLVPGPRIGVTIPGEFAAPAMGSSACAVVKVPLDVPPEAMSFLAGAGQSFVIPQVIDSSLTIPQRIDDLARRTIELWAAIGDDPSTSISIEQPWTITGNRRPEVAPTPEFAVFRTLVDHLTGMRVVAKFPAPPGIRAYLLAPVSETNQGTIVAWNESAPSNRSFLSGSFGQGQIRLVDLFGNSSSPAIDAYADQDLISQPTPPLRIPLSSSPIFIEHVDLPLLKFIASLKIDPPILQATTRANEHAIRFKNTWSSGLTSRLTIVRPGGTLSADGTADRSWTISPRLGRATLAAGEEARIPVMIGFGPGEEAGGKQFTIDFELATERQYGRIRVNTDIELALDGIDLQAHAFRAPGPDGEDIVIEASLFNETGHSINAEITAFAPGLPRDRRAVPALETNSRATRRFVFKGLAKQLSGARVLLSVTEEQRGVRLNKSVIVP